jgi:hypothetical protein
MLSNKVIQYNKSELVTLEDSIGVTPGNTITDITINETEKTAGEINEYSRTDHKHYFDISNIKVNMTTPYKVMDVENVDDANVLRNRKIVVGKTIENINSTQNYYYKIFYPVITNKNNYIRLKFSINNPSDSVYTAAYIHEILITIKITNGGTKTCSIEAVRGSLYNIQTSNTTTNPILVSDTYNNIYVHFINNYVGNSELYYTYEELTTNNYFDINSDISEMVKVSSTPLPNMTTIIDVPTVSTQFTKIYGVGAYLFQTNTTNPISDSSSPFYRTSTTWSSITSPISGFQRTA